jgi:hypothetical protein
MGTLASELAPHAQRLAAAPRVYVDANVPAGLVTFMRERLRWDALFVVEHDDLRRAPDEEHYRLAGTLGRTLISLDHDYFDDRRFPPERSGGVIVLSAPDERAMKQLLGRINRTLFRSRHAGAAPQSTDPPLHGRKLHADVDWPPRRR